MKKIGIIGAMEIEVEDLISALMPSEGETKIRITAVGELLFYEGRLGNVDVIVTKSGICKVNAALCAQRLIIQFGATHIINSGIAGALGKGLGIFDIVVSTDVVYHDVDASVFGYKVTQIPQMAESDFQADKELISIVKKAVKSLEDFKEKKIAFGRIASGDQFISDSEKKNYIKEICNPLCVEMEGAGVAQACYLNKTPFVIIRTLSDTADDSKNGTTSFNEKIAAKKSSELLIAILKNIKG